MSALVFKSCFLSGQPREKAMVRLSPRLNELLGQLAPDGPVWDICCDHGLLGRAALEKGFAPVYFVDQVPHITAALETRLAGDVRAHVICAPGQDLGARGVSVTGTLVIAGVGGARIREILEGLAASGTLQASRLVLSPHKDEKDFWNWMDTQSLWRARVRLEVVEGARARFIGVYERV